MNAKFAVAALALAAVSAGTAEAKDPLRVCASTKEAPYSEEGGTGFENRVAEVIAEGTGRPLEMVWINKEAIYLVRDGIDAGLCDVIVGTDTDDPRLLTTQPYYRTGYVLLTKKDTPPPSDRWEVIADPEFDTIAYRQYGPGDVLLKYAGKYENNLIYVMSLTNFEERRNKYTNVSPLKVVAEVANGSADLAIVFAPEAARYVKESTTPLTMTMISDSLTRANGQVVPLQFNQSVGVVKSKPELRAEIDAALTNRKGEIEAILANEGIPTLPPSS